MHKRLDLRTLFGQPAGLSPRTQSPRDSAELGTSLLGLQRSFATMKLAAAPRSGELGWRHLQSPEKVDLQLGTLVGAGSYGIVREASFDGSKVAVKVLKKKRGSQARERVLRKLAREIDLLTKLQDCCNVVQLLSVLEDDEHAYLVCELCRGGDLERVLLERGPFSERAAAKVVYEALKMVTACHDNGVIHGDVKPANFLLRQHHKDPVAFLEAGIQAGAWLKSVDFGCSQVVQRNGLLTRRTGTPVYMAPEIFCRSYGLQADTWSIGIMFYQLIASRFPFWNSLEECRNKSVNEVMHAVLNGKIPFNYGPWLKMSDEGLDLIRQLTIRDPELRISAAQALQHAWFKTQLNSAPPALPQRSNIIPRAPKQRPVPQPAQQEASREPEQHQQRQHQPELAINPMGTWQPELAPMMMLSYQP